MGVLFLVVLVVGERKFLYVVGMYLIILWGLILILDYLRIVVKCCYYNIGGYMMFVELGMVFWYDLVVLVIVGIFVSMIVNWLNKWK